MTDIVASDALMALVQVVMIDLVLAGDNAVVIGLAAAGLPAEMRKAATLTGVTNGTAHRTGNVVNRGGAMAVQGRPNVFGLFAWFSMNYSKLIK